MKILFRTSSVSRTSRTDAPGDQDRAGEPVCVGAGSVEFLQAMDPQRSRRPGRTVVAEQLEADVSSAAFFF